jgi:hypothetical protein
VRWSGRINHVELNRVAASPDAMGIVKPAKTPGAESLGAKGTERGGPTGRARLAARCQAGRRGQDDGGRSAQDRRAAGRGFARESRTSTGRWWSSSSSSSVTRYRRARDESWDERVQDRDLPMTLVTEGTSRGVDVG